MGTQKKFLIEGRYVHEKAYCETGKRTWGMGAVKEAIKAIAAAIYPTATDVIALESEG